MTFRPPPLDDADVAALMSAARAALARRGGGWQASDPSDPGVALLEAFAHVTAEELKRVNRVPEAAQLGFMGLLGARLKPAMAASTTLEFTLASVRPDDVVVPVGVRIAAERAPETVFTTIEPALIPAGALSGRARAAQVGYAADVVIGHGDGMPGQKLQLPHRPLPGALPTGADVQVLVEAPLSAAPAGADIVDRDGRTFMRYGPVDRLSGAEAAVFEIDRQAGLIGFPLSGPFIPPDGAEIRATFFWMEGGPNMRLPADALTESLSPLPGVSVRNPEPVEPGLPAETVDHGLRRGALAALAAGSAVRPRDYEAIAIASHAAVARAKATALSERWGFAKPGTVEVALLPVVPPGPEGAVRPEDVAAAKATVGDALVSSVQAALKDARPLGVDVQVAWTPLKAVGVRAKAFAARGADKKAIAADIRARLNALMQPMPGGRWPDGRPLGQPLRLSEVIEAISATPGVRAVDAVELRPRDPMDGRVDGLAADAAQAGVWYAAVGGRLYRTIDDGAGWNVILGSEARISGVAAHPAVSGMAAAAADDGSIWVTRDGGQTFEAFAKAERAPATMLWADGGERPRLLLGGDMAFSETVGPSGSSDTPSPQKLVAEDGWIGPAYAAAAFPDGRGGRLVAVARQGLGGVVLSNDSGWDGGYVPVGLEGQDVRALAFFEAEGAIWLVAGCAQPVLSSSSNCYLAKVDADVASVDAWRPADAGWRPGAFLSLHSGDGRVYAGTADNGLLIGIFEGDGLEWHAPGPDSGLPTNLSGEGRAGLFAFASPPGRAGHLMAGGDGPLLWSRDGGRKFEDVSDRPGASRITIPSNWAICADAHEIEVVDDVG